MERKYNDLWQGGPWEQPSRPVVNPPHIPKPQRPVLRVRKKRRSPLKIFLIFLTVFAVAAGVLIAAGLNGLLPFYVDDPGYSSFPAFPYEKYPQLQQPTPDYSTPPFIPSAPTGTGVTVTFSPAGEEELSYEEIYTQCAPSVVSITARNIRASSGGTGVVLTADGYILTNAHVVAGASRVQVITFDNRVGHARLVGFDGDEDLAVLKVDLTDLTPAAFGSSDELRIGQEVAAIGDAMGYRSTITDGIVSALDREVTVDGIAMPFIQTSASINFGNSGGALIDRYGRVVGITTVKIVSADGSSESLGFAIPSTRVKYVCDKLIAGEKIVHGSLGLTVNTIPVGEMGLEILSVVENSRAYAEGLRPGDIILRINGEPLTDSKLFTRLKLTMGAGDTLDLTVQRGDEVFACTVPLTPTEELEGYR